MTRARTLSASSILLGVAALALSATPAGAWEAQTTSAGLAEQAASGSTLHTRLVELGFSGGLYEPLTVPPADAPALIESLELYSPIHGFVPDKRGRQFAVGWLVAGAVLADSSSAWAANHFFDPSNGAGLAFESTFGDKLAAMIGGGSSIPAHGVPAPDWVTAGENPLGLAGFVEQYAKAVRAATPGERSRHMAGALIAAGAIVHVLQDMGSPSHVRSDIRAHLDSLGPAAGDVGSRFERVAALAYGRLGVPAAAAIARPTLRAFFTAQDGNGLADLTSTTYFSSYTLPRAVGIGTQRERNRLEERLTTALVRPAPALPARLNLLAASGDDGATLDGPGGVCRARYHVADAVLRFTTDDECMLEQVDAILPQVVGYGAGLVDWLFRGELVIGNGEITARTAFGAGRLEVFSEDGRGVRTAISDQQVSATSAGGVVARVTAPADAARVVALFTGVDDVGEPLVAVGVLAPAAATEE